MPTDTGLHEPCIDKGPRLCLAARMLKRLAVLFVLATVLALPVRPYAAEPLNLSTAKQDINRYVTSGEYGNDVAKAALKASQYLGKRLAKAPKPGEKRAIVFDIDETTLSNLTHIMAQDYGYIPEVWRRWVEEGQARAIIPVQLVYDLAVKNKVAVFFITARKRADAAATEKNLREVGYETWTKVYYADDNYKESSRAYKIGVRRQIVNEGYTIVANIGDQDSDLAGGLAERAFKLPNPFYIVK
jgi:predicted secreted acid phosphatase